MVESTEEVPPCPLCGGELHYRDSRKRIIVHEGGQKDWLMVRRYRCRSCHHYQTELPDCVVPYKHYETEVICGVLDDIVTSDDIDSEQYPCELTMQRWRDWATQKEKEIERVLQTDTSGISPCRGADEKEESQLRKLKAQTEAWLETFIRIFCNIN